MTCDLNLSEDQRQILDAAAAMLSQGHPVSRLRDSQDDTVTAIAEFGGFNLALPEDQGGTGFTLVEEALLHVLLGRHVVSVRALAAPIAARVAAGQGAADLASAFADGTETVCAAIPAAEGTLLIASEGCRYALLFGDRHLSILDLADTHTTVVEGLGHGSVTTRRLALGAGKTVAASNGGPLLEIADLLVSAQLLGIAEATLDLAVDYAQVRRQFGKPIGAFQAIKHQAADMAIQAEMLSTQLDMAAIAARDGRADAAFQIAALRRLAPRVALFNARTCIQIHGGIGFSAEADAHHYLKQAHVLSRLGAAAPLLDLAAALAPYQPA
ncbi:acyl-CoA dehydrogenase family protein [Pseudoruegeria sp. HB172150]|uniref:acyl-CoA dehydrogenase family protein n=1 Tax=Pseudoruegeria sp. HB172150 TaxID=2721164 RepID=UPI00155555AB|nr:acyl-CoA dehydrogenase family protein [Pseudoruegeria sp. HB172150]